MSLNRAFLSWLLVCFVFIKKSNSQNQFVFGVFPTIDHSGVLSERWNYNFYYFGAFPLINLQSPDIKQDAQFLMLYFEQSTTYKIADGWNVTGSYVFQQSNVNSAAPTNENRFYIQSAYAHKVFEWQLKHRLRWDARWIKNPYTSEIPFTHRLRYFLGFEKYLNINKPTYYLTFYEELFFNTVSGANPVFEENWAYVALGKKSNDTHKLEMGLLYITWVNGMDSWLNQFYLQFTWISTINWKRTRE
jgi:hypothetical protein